MPSDTFKITMKTDISFVAVRRDQSHRHAVCAQRQNMHSEQHAGHAEAERTHCERSSLEPDHDDKAETSQGRSHAADLAGEQGEMLSGVDRVKSAGRRRRASRRREAWAAVTGLTIIAGGTMACPRLMFGAKHCSMLSDLHRALEGRLCQGACVRMRREEDGICQPRSSDEAVTR